MSGSSISSVRSSFLNYVAQQTQNSVTLPEGRDSTANGALETYLQSTFQQTVEFGQQLSELSKGVTISTLSPEQQEKIDSARKDFETKGKLHEKTMDMTMDLTEFAPPALDLGQIFPTSVSPMQNGMFTVEFARASEDAAIISETGALQEHRGTLFVDTTPNEAGIVVCYAQDKPVARREFQQLAQGSEIRTFDLNPSHPAKQELVPLLTTVVDLSARMEVAQRTGNKEAQSKLEEEGKAIQADLATYSKFMEFLTDGSSGTPTSIENKGDGMLVLNLQRNEEKAGQILLDLRPGLAGVQVANVSA